MTEKTRFHDINRTKLVDFFQKGDKYARTLGFELEHVILHAGTDQPVSYSEPGGVRDVLVQLSEEYDRTLRDGDDIIGCQSPDEVVTIEPAGQIEVSLGPCKSASQVESLYRGFRS